MPRIFLPLKEPSEKIHITGERARYITTVLRCREGDEILIFDGKGTSYRTIINNITKKEVLVELSGVIPCDTESPLDLVLIQGILRGEKMDIVIQKTTELGVKEIIPAITERSQIRETRKLSRWRKIAEEASRQCGRTIVPVIHELIPFNDIFSSASPCSPYFRKYNGLLFWEDRGIKITEVKERLGGCQSLIIAIGPEGGFTREEVRAAERRDFIVASLGRRILRAETAAISAVTMIQFLFGDLG
ncbi:MAG: 16S rRNA (uracil(1498)-N(3))-methyltransferase [Thermodesulfovibrionales bacterium]